VAYTAPEILKGREPSAKSDIYSLGILIWQMMSRKCPYELLDNEVVIYKVAKSLVVLIIPRLLESCVFQVVKFNFRPPLDLLKEDGLSKLCCLCWDEKPTNRPSAAQASDFLNNL
jgi:serine/threonine protein kinase